MEDCDIFKIWEEYKNSLFSFIKKRVSEHDDAKDILQDVLLKSYQYCSKGKKVINLKAWLYKITYNTIIDYHKETNNTKTTTKDVAYENSNPSIVGEASDYIKVLLQLLPQEYALPLYMSDIDGIDQKIIADKLNLTLPNTKSRIQRARIKLKEKFLECCEVSFGENGEMVSFDIKPHCSELQAEKKRIINM